MFSVVSADDGTAKSARISGLQVGGKTGTAQDGEEAQDHGWFIGFALKDGKPVVSVASSSRTLAKVAAPRRLASAAWS